MILPQAFIDCLYFGYVSENDKLNELYKDITKEGWKPSSIKRFFHHSIQNSLEKDPIFKSMWKRFLIYGQLPWKSATHFKYKILQDKKEAINLYTALYNDYTKLFVEGIHKIKGSKCTRQLVVWTPVITKERDEFIHIHCRGEFIFTFVYPFVNAYYDCKIITQM